MRCICWIFLHGKLIASMSVLDISEAMEIAVKSSAPTWSIWSQWQAQVFQFHQQIYNLGCLVADLEASSQSIHLQMKELRNKNALLRSRLSIAQRPPAHVPRAVAQQAEPIEVEPACTFSVCPGLLPGHSQSGFHPDVNWGEIESFNMDVPPPVAADAISTRASLIDGRLGTVVQWRIHCFSAQLAGAMGRSLVSPPFHVGSLSGLRLMVAAKVQGVFAPRGQRARKAHKKLVTEGPLDGCLMLKVPNAPDLPLEYHVFIGDHRGGPFANNFFDQCVATQSHLGIDWLQERGHDGSLLVGVEIAAQTD